MTVGNLDRRIQLQRQSSTTDSDGSLIATWTTFVSVWAKRKDVPSTRRGQLYASDQHEDSLFTEFTIRYISGIDGSERIIDEHGVVYDLVGAPTELGRKEYLMIVSERGVVKS